RMSAIQALTFLAVGMCRNSLGPCALECGPRTPVTTNWVFGYFSPSIAMKGIEPPSPMNATGLPKCATLALFNDAASQGASFGEFQPVWPSSASNATSAPYGALCSSSRLSAAVAFVASQVGGRRMLSLAVE